MCVCVVVSPCVCVCEGVFAKRYVREERKLKDVAVLLYPHLAPPCGQYRDCRHIHTWCRHVASTGTAGIYTHGAAMWPVQGLQAGCAGAQGVVTVCVCVCVCVCMSVKCL